MVEKYVNFILQRKHSLTAIFHENLGKPVPERHHSGFYRSKDDAADGDDKWSYKMRNVPVILSST